MKQWWRVGLLALAGAAAPAAADCPDAQAVAAYVADFAAARPSRGFGKDLSPDDARCARAKVIEALPGVLGARVGYKTVFASAEAQQRFGVSGPAWGAMFAADMLMNSTLVPVKLGARLHYEADLIVIVKDAGLADAASPLEALDHISYLVPFIQLPDPMIDGPLTGVESVATNAAFRAGVLGPRIPVVPSRALLAELAQMDVVIAEERTGREIGRAKGDVLMGQPIRVAMWLARALKRDGIELQPGELLSLGSFLPSAPAEAGTTISVTYAGLADSPVVIVHFQ
ncbi:MAG TPA: hypothetical protein VMC81_03230 [Rhodocyclaceae bacterium]|nr:hypothetical protein [Rhodocyclaceae bacterium]